MSSEEYQDALNFMEKSLEIHQGQVGIFWYNGALNTLYGVHKESPQGKQANCGGGLVSCSLLHKNLWKKEYNKQKFTTGSGPFIGDYKDRPRGRVFYNPKTKKFFVCVGSWINEHPEAVDVIVDEFGLENEDYEFSIQEHWELGMGYGD
ncbi:MAG: hypothetical protein LIO91_10770 [Bacteroidales bacterium]|nr:hypothetical protein [Bacteroidales bacterium]